MQKLDRIFTVVRDSFQATKCSRYNLL
jgi:hypothetical protein